MDKPYDYQESKIFPIGTSSIAVDQWIEEQKQLADIKQVWRYPHPTDLFGTPEVSVLGYKKDGRTPS